MTADKEFTQIAHTSHTFAFNCFSKEILERASKLNAVRKMSCPKGFIFVIIMNYNSQFAPLRKHPSRGVYLDLFCSGGQHSVRPLCCM